MDYPKWIIIFAKILKCMGKVLNPFITRGYIPDECFCDREEETQRLTKSLVNGNDVVLFSPRRMGKTGLIGHVFERKEIKDGYYTFFVDILHTTSLREFTFFLGKEVFKALQPAGRKVIDSLVGALKSLQGKITYDSVTGQPSFGISLGDIQRPEFTLEEILNYLDNAGKPCIVAIDEFQQITEYEDDNVEAFLRGHIQRMKNCHFVFAGSKRSIMSTMFQSPARPFYKSADPLELKAIDKGVYSEFVVKKFSEYDKSVSKETVEYVYDLFDGYTYYMQRTFNEAFASVEREGECSIDVISDSIDSILLMNEVQFAELMSGLTENQKRVLAAIASEVRIRKVNAADFINRHKLSTPSVVNAAIRKLLKEDIITVDLKEYSIPDKFLWLWVNREYNNA